MHDNEVLRQFTLDQRRRGLSPRTSLERRRHVVRLSRWLGSTNVLAATEEEIQLFLDARPGRSGSGLGMRSRYTFISNLHAFYTWAVKTGLADRDPTTDIVRPRLPRLLPRPVTDSDLETALDRASRRERAMLLLAAFAGFRAMEVAALDREDILESYREPTLRVRGKGNKEATVPLHADLAAALRMLPLPRQGPVFVHPATGRRMSAEQVSRQMNRFLESVGVDASFHQLRHWFGTRVQEETGDLRVTQELMRHASPNTTAGYAEFSKKKAADAIRGLSVTRRNKRAPDAAED